MRNWFGFVAAAWIVVSGALAPAVAGSAKPKAAKTSGIPASQDSAAQVLEISPRHGEFVDVALPSGGTPIRTWVVYPERKDKVGVVIVIQEIYGLSDWIRGVADQLAADGFIAVAPDMISGLGPGGGGTDSVASRDEVVKLTRGLTDAMVRERLDAVRGYAAKLPAANGKVGTVGFCWGGARSFAYAAADPPPAAAVVYYGTAPDSATLLQVRAPVQGHFGSDDARVNATIGPAEKVLGKLDRSFEDYTYEGAGHGFLRQQGDREGANLKASQQAWPRTIAFLKKHLK